MTAADMVALDLQGESTEGELAPSSESHMHLAVYEPVPTCGAWYTLIPFMPLQRPSRVSRYPPSWTRW